MTHGQCRTPERLVELIHQFAAIRMAHLAEQAVQTAVQEERSRMAREIHDTLAQAFTGILLQLGAAERVLADDPGQGQAHLQKAGELAREGLAEARRSVQALRPQALETMDFPEVLSRMVQRLAADGTPRLQFRLRGAPRALPPDVADHLLRIGQEALTNALRHARASLIDVELTFAEAKVTLCVQDNGHGFAVDCPERTGGYGLVGMRERADILGAELAVSSGPKQGTRVTVRWRFP
jgi:signal transduction histidine kinase